MKLFLYLFTILVLLSSCGIEKIPVAECNEMVSALTEKLIDKTAAEEREMNKQNFEFDEKCKQMAKGLGYSNVIGGYYDTYSNSCYVRYLKDGAAESSPIDQMQPIN